MQATTAAFRLAVAGSHDAAWSCEVLRDGVVEDELELLGGSVVQDGNSAVRGRVSCTLGARALPTSSASPVAPYGTELRIRKGVVLASGATELVTLIVARIEEVDARETAAGYAVAVTGRDRSSLIARSRFTAPYVPTAGALMTAEIRAMVDDGVDGLEWEVTDSGFVVPSGIAWPALGDRLEAARSMAASMGYEVFANGPGRMVLRPIPEPTDTPVTELTEGTVLITAGKRWSSLETYNAVLATGEASGRSVARAFVTDDDPGSPTYWLGPFGQAPRGYTSPLILTDGQAEAAGRGILAGEVGATENVDATAVADPALEPGDVALIRRLEGVGVDTTNIVDRVTHPLGVAGAMDLATRSRRVLL